VYQHYLPLQSANQPVIENAVQHRETETRKRKEYKKIIYVNPFLTPLRLCGLISRLRSGFLAIRLGSGLPD